MDVTVVDGSLRRSERERRQRVIEDGVTVFSVQGNDEKLNTITKNEHICVDGIEPDPLTVDEALNGSNAEEWLHAMESEYSSLIENNTWSLCDLQAVKKAINCKWVFKSETDNNGNIVRFKARLVAKGCSQRKGIDYDETYSHVVRYTSIRYLFALVAQYDLKIWQLDAVTAFLQGDLEDTICMKQPEKFDDGTGHVCMLKKSIYGLNKQVESGIENSITCSHKLDSSAPRKIHAFIIGVKATK